ncbi:hypothetical protein BGW41_006899 [Actinomortierella wolfii]|nr:hypothetical protein BGW41_006899 [Actinomortierella wolfii]
MIAATSGLPSSSSMSGQARRGYRVGLARNKHYTYNTRAELLKLNKRYSFLRLQDRYQFIQQTSNDIPGVGSVPAINIESDSEYYGPVRVGTPGQMFNLNFDTGSADIWLPSTSCWSSACRTHARFNTTSSSTFKMDGRVWSIEYGDSSKASGILGSDMINVGGISVRQTFGLAKMESKEFVTSAEDGMFGLGFNSIQSVDNVQTFMDNAIAAGVLAQPVFSVFLPAERVNGGVGGEYLFGGINTTHYTGDLTYVPVTMKGYWQVAVDDVAVDGNQLGTSAQGIIDTGTTLVLVDDTTAAAIHSHIEGSVWTNDGWTVPCSLVTSNATVSFMMGGQFFDVAFADLSREEVGGGNCYSGVQGGEAQLWILGDVFIKNNYCVFDQGEARIGIAPIKY